MANQGWQTITSNKTKKNNQDEPVNFDPIPARQREAQAKIAAALAAKKEMNLPIQSNPNQDWNNVTISKPQQKQKVSLPQREASAIKINESGDIIQIKKVSPQMARAVIDARIAKKWTQVQLSHNSTIDVKTISEIEKGKGLYDANVFNKLCKTFGITIERNYLLEIKN